MCAGCSADERERAESDVRRALGTRASGSGETWIVSVINLQSRWSVTLDGPGIRALNCTAPPGRLAEAIQEALQAKMGAPPAAAPAHAAPPPASVAPAAPVRATAAPAASPSNACSAISDSASPSRPSPASPST
jgi:hypothetical protein